MVVSNTIVFFGSIVVVFNITGVQDTSHEYKNKKDEDDETSKISDKDIPEEDVHHPQLTSQTERWMYKLRPIEPKNHPGVDDYAHTQIVHYAMIQYYLRKGINKFKKVGGAAVEK